MPLEANYVNIKDWKELHADSDEFKTTEYICLMARQWLLPGITEENYLEVYLRLHALEVGWNERNAELREAMEPSSPLTLDDIKRRIGLEFSGRWWGDESARTWWHKFFHHHKEQVKDASFWNHIKDDCSDCGISLKAEQVATSQNPPHRVLCSSCADTEAIEEYYASLA